MPRAIGARVGVNETAAPAHPRPAARFCSISGVCRCTPPTPYGVIEPITSLPSRCGFSDLPAPEVPQAGDDHDVVGLEQPGGEARGERERDRGRVAPGHGDPAGAGQRVALPGTVGVRQLGQPVGPGAGVLAVVELRPGGRVGEPVVGAAVDDDDVSSGSCGGDGCRWRRAAGRGRRRRGPPSVSAVVGSSTRSASGDQVRLVLAERGAGVATPRSGRRSPTLGMPEQQPQQLTARVAARTGHGDRDPHGA